MALSSTSWSRRIGQFSERELGAGRFAELLRQFPDIVQVVSEGGAMWASLPPDSAIPDLHSPGVRFRSFVAEARIRVPWSGATRRDYLGQLYDAWADGRLTTLGKFAEVVTPSAVGEPWVAAMRDAVRNALTREVEPPVLIAHPGPGLSTGETPVGQFDGSSREDWVRRAHVAWLVWLLKRATKYLDLNLAASGMREALFEPTEADADQLIAAAIEVANIATTAAAPDPIAQQVAGTDFDLTATWARALRDAGMVIPKSFAERESYLREIFDAWAEGRLKKLKDLDATIVSAGLKESSIKLRYPLRTALTMPKDEPLLPYDPDSAPTYSEMTVLPCGLKDETTWVRKAHIAWVMRALVRLSGAQRSETPLTAASQGARSMLFEGSDPEQLGVLDAAVAMAFGELQRLEASRATERGQEEEDPIMPDVTERKPGAAQAELS